MALSICGIPLPPFRSLQDVFTDAQFTFPTLNDLERMNNRMVNNLIYYQTNYFLCYVLIFLIVGTLYPKDMITGAVAMTVALLFYIKICKDQEIIRQYGKAAENLVPVAVVAIVLLLLYVIGSIFVFLWGVVAPVMVIFLHASCRKRNLKNKFANVADVFKENPSPMTILLSFLCEKQEEANIVTTRMK